MERHSHESNRAKAGIARVFINPFGVPSAAESRAITAVAAKGHLSPYNSLVLEFQCKMTHRGILVGDNHHSGFWNSRHLSRAEQGMNLVCTTVRE